MPNDRLQFLEMVRVEGNGPNLEAMLKQQAEMREERLKVMKEELIKDIFGQRKPTTTKLCDLFQRKEKIGIEIELENVRFDDIPRLHHWHITGDGSLRNNGFELVSNMPRNGNVLNNSIEELFKQPFLKDADPSWRCGTHIHIDVRMWTPTQLKIFMVLYLTEEMKLFKHMNSEERVHSNFCTPIQYSAGLLQRLFNERIDMLARNWNKYTAMNLCPIRNQGSIEWRGSNSTKNKDELIGLIQHLYSIVERVEGFKTVEGAIDSIRESNPNIYEMCRFYNEINN